MVLLSHQDRPERGRWRQAAPELLREWRERAHRNLMNSEGRLVTLEDNTAHTQGLEPVDRDEFGVPVMERPKAERFLEGREVTESVLKDEIDLMLRLKQFNPEAYRRRIRLLKQVGGLSHLSDEEAEVQVYALCRKLAETHVQKVHELMGAGGGWRGVVLEP